MRKRAGNLSATVSVMAALALVFAIPAHAVNIIEAQSETSAAGLAGRHLQPRHRPSCSPQRLNSSSPRPPGTRRSASPRSSSSIRPLRRNPAGNLKTVLVDLPPGLSVNPQATPQCVLEGGKFPAGGCPADTQVGISAVTASGLARHPARPRSRSRSTTSSPRPGEPARFGFTLDLRLGLVDLGEVFLNAGVAWEGDYHEYFTIHVPRCPAGSKILKNRLVFDGTTGTAARRAVAAS